MAMTEGVQERESAGQDLLWSFEHPYAFLFHSQGARTETRSDRPVEPRGSTKTPPISTLEPCSKLSLAVDNPQLKIQRRHLLTSRNVTEGP